MLTENDFLLPKKKNSLDWYTKFIITIPSLSFSVWCLATTAYNALLYEHLKNILKNVTIHIET
jgi:hypothetical protein